LSEKNCFVISPISDEGSDVRKRADQLFEYVIEKTVKKFGYSPIRADMIPRPGIITSQIIEHLLKDDLVIADLTGRNPNVFYELGIRHVIRKPVIQIKDVSEIIPFDLHNMRTIDVDYRYIKSMDRCRDEITKQIEEIQGNPETATPVSYTVDLMKLENRGEPESKLIMEMVSEMQALRSQVDKLSKQNQDKNIGIDTIGVSFDDTSKDEKLIIHSFMMELCERDRRHPREFFEDYFIDDIIRARLGGFSRDYVYQFISKYERTWSHIEIINNTMVRLTPAGKAFCAGL
jgi:hypothetical protein